jgi:N-glycosylase/DNA lyase
MEIGVAQRGKSKITVHGTDIKKAMKDLKYRFGLNDNMKKIYEQISTDEFVKSAIATYPGMRVTVNDPWETTVCFIISQFNNVKRIRLITKNIVKRFGYSIDGTDTRTFPSSEVLSGASITDFRECNAGFRAKYLKSAAEYCTNNLDLYKLRSKSYEELKEELMTISGVGDKVADCIALMGYGKLEAFPIDVWIKRMMERLYFKGKVMKPREIHDFAIGRWGDMAGYAQQYIFHYARDNKL